jgi:hypothetical protein
MSTTITSYGWLVLGYLSIKPQKLIIVTLSGDTQIGKMYVFVQGFNKRALPTTITKLGKVQFSIRFMSMLHHRFANATQVSLCKSNW